MRVAFLISGLHEGGAERVVTVLANEMKHRKHDVHILVTWSEKCVYKLDSDIPIIPIYKDFPSENSYRNNKRYHIQKKIVSNYLKLKYRDTKKINNSLEYWKALVRNKEKAKVLASYLENYKINVLYSFMDNSNIIAGIAKRYTKAKIIVSQRIFHDYSDLNIPKNRLINLSYSKANTVVFQTKEQEETFSQTVKDKGVVIHNPIKYDLPTPYSGKRKSVIVNYCRLTEQKNLILLIKAFFRLSQEYKDYSLEIYGNGDQREELISMIYSLRLEHKAFIYPFLSNIHQRIMDYSMFVMTSDYEGMPNSLLEAMAIGLPVISTDCLGGGAKAVINDGINGLLIPCNDEEALYNAMKKYVENPDFAMKCGNKALDIKENLSVEKITDQWLALAEG